MVHMNLGRNKRGDMGIEQVCQTLCRTINSEIEHEPNLNSFVLVILSSPTICVFQVLNLVIL
jgi:hypothetical protein